MSFLNATVNTNGLDTYDIIIVGGGTAGCVIANRLTENPNVSILLIEAGEDRNNDPCVTTPGLFAQLLGNPDFDWQYASIPQKNLNGRVVPLPRGKVLGGSSAINLQALVYPSRATVDTTVELGIKGWDWEIMLPYYQKFQTACSPKSPTPHHKHLDPNLGGTSGPIQSSYAANIDPLHAAWINSLSSIGYGINRDPLSGTSIGACALPCSVTADTRERSHSGNEYYQKASKRPNLHLLRKAHAKRIVLEANAAGQYIATGVIVSQSGQETMMRARQEIILSAGAVGSPQLLELSGIGNATLLGSHGIEVLIDNPNVGENLQDHQSTGLCYEVNDGVETLDRMFRDPAYAQTAVQEYQAKKTGPLANSPVQAMAYLPMDCFSSPMGQQELKHLLDQHISSKKTADIPHGITIQHNILRRLLESSSEASAVVIPISMGIYPEVDTVSSGAPVIPTSGAYFTQLSMLSHPFSRRSTHISSSKYESHPQIDLAYLSHPLDIELFARHQQFLEKIASTPPLDSYLKPNGRRLPAGKDATTIEGARDLVRSYGATFHHLCGSCSMMSRANGGVVNERMVVWGTKNLRVCDASIIPIVPRGNIMATVYAWAERGADIIKQDLGLSIHQTL